jgi:hypothetical protein
MFHFYGTYLPNLDAKKEIKIIICFNSADSLQNKKKKKVMLISGNWYM